MKRSEFLKVMGLTAVGAAFAPSILANGKQTNNVSRIATDIKDLKASVNRPVTFLSSVQVTEEAFTPDMQKSTPIA